MFSVPCAAVDRRELRLILGELCDHLLSGVFLGAALGDLCVFDWCWDLDCVEEDGVLFLEALHRFGGALDCGVRGLFVAFAERFVLVRELINIAAHAVDELSFAEVESFHGTLSPLAVPCELGVSLVDLCRDGAPFVHNGDRALKVGIDLLDLICCLRKIGSFYPCHDHIDHIVRQDFAQDLAYCVEDVCEPLDRRIEQCQFFCSSIQLLDLSVNLGET